MSLLSHGFDNAKALLLHGFAAMVGGVVTPPASPGVYDIVASFVAELGDPALHPDPTAAEPGCGAPIQGTVAGVLANAAQLVTVAGDANLGVSVDVTDLLGAWSISGTPTVTATLVRPFAPATTAPGFVTTAASVVNVTATSTAAAKTLVRFAVAAGTQVPGDVYDVHVSLALSDAPTTTHVLVFSVYVESD
jgi:hypothetical protein